MKNTAKYKPFGKIPITNRQWPDREITQPPIWCSVDLRDGNQALAVPMGIQQKLAYFDLLVKLGFKETEVGFPSASQTEYDFLRRLIEENRIPDDVTIQVLCQAREELVKKTFECLKGAKSAIFHIYNSTSPAQRKYTFNMSKEEIIQVAVDGIRCVKNCLPLAEGTDIRLQYSPESFSNTEIEFAVEICEAVKKEWGPTPEKKMILNLPTTVECSSCCKHADQIEYFCTHITDRDSVIVSLHNHNDRGEGVASCQLALQAGADRVEGTLFGNGERTGNLDIVTVALNMFTQGVDPGLDFSNISQVAETYMQLTGMPIHPRHPYAGELVFTAFSGSHQDAIRKGMAARATMAETDIWDVPYLPIDPHDIGREYEEIIRINSQSGKGGIGFLLEQKYGIVLPRKLREVVGYAVKDVSDKQHRELSPDDVYDIFRGQFVNVSSPLKIADVHYTRKDGSFTAEVTAMLQGEKKVITGDGNGRLDAVANAIKAHMNIDFSIISYSEQALEQGSHSKAMSYIEIRNSDGSISWGAGTHNDIIMSSVHALVCAINRGITANS